MRLDVADKRGTIAPTISMPVPCSLGNLPLPIATGNHLNFLVSWSNTWGSPQIAAPFR